MSAFSVRYGSLQCDDVVGRLIRNPAYGGPGVSLNGWRYRPSISNHTKPAFQEALKNDIAEKGVRNPILVWALPEGVFLTFGGSRLRACRALKLESIPAIINDYTGLYDSYDEVRETNWASYFTDPPRAFTFGEDGADYHYNLERARRHEHDPAGFEWVENDAPFINQEFPWVNKD